MGPVLASLRARVSRGRLITIIYDIYPDVAIETGALTSTLVIEALRLLERSSYTVSDRLVVLSDGFRHQLIARGVENERITVVPVWLPLNEIVPQSKPTEWLTSHGLETSQPVALYAGTLGNVSGAQILPELARLLEEAPKVQVLVVGDGELKPQLAQEAAEREISNLRLLPFQDRTLVPVVQSSADVALVTLSPGRGRTSVPSKVVAYLAAGTPVVAAVDEDSDTAKCVQAAGGLVVPPGDAAAMADAVRRLCFSRALDTARNQARGYFEAIHSDSVVLPKFEDVLTSVSDP
jgi:colanic acid biosynthesis glycosyl transferase WcaI